MKKITLGSFNEFLDLLGKYQRREKQYKDVKITRHVPLKFFMVRDERESSGVVKYQMKNLRFKTFRDGDLVALLVHDGTNASYKLSYLDADDCTTFSNGMNPIYLTEEFANKILAWCKTKNIKLLNKVLIQGSK